MFYVIYIVLSLFLLVQSKKYVEKEQVELFVNKVGPYSNPDETYHYYSLPVCRPNEVSYKRMSLGQVIKGDRLSYSLFKVNFLENSFKVFLCKKKLLQSDVASLKAAIEDDYYFEFFVEDIPMRGFVGEVKEVSIWPHTHISYVYVHFDFILYHKDNEIKFAKVFPTQLLKLPDAPSKPLDLEMTYSIKWQVFHPTDLKLSTDSRARSSHKQALKIHWISVINSTLLAVFLVIFNGLVLLRILKNDFSKFNNTSPLDAGNFEDSDNGWKMIHADVFRFPHYKSLLSSFLGVGTQILALAGSLLVMAAFNMFHVRNHGTLQVAAVIIYAFTCCLAGFVSNSFYIQIGGKNWVGNMLLTSSIFTGPLFLCWFFVNTVHWAYQSTQALPFSTILFLFSIFVFIGYPLCLLGGIFGKNCVNNKFNAPCRTRNVAREIPPAEWYNKRTIHSFVGGLVCFASISVQMNYVFETMWGRQHYVLYEILLLTFLLLILVSGAMGITLIYFQLSSENFLWWWRAFVNTGSTGFFLYIYSVYFYHSKSNMHGFLQSVDYFTYNLLLSYAFFLSFGAVSFYCSLIFIKYIYRNLKMD